MRIARSVLVLSLSHAIAACASRSQSASDAGMLLAERAQLRIIAGETTWVAHGPGYELVARSKVDLARALPRLEDRVAMLRRVFPGDSSFAVVATLRHAPVAGEPLSKVPPLPSTQKGNVIDLIIADAKALKERRNRRGPAGGLGMFGEGDVAVPVIRGWLAAHAGAATSAPANSSQLRGELEDPRVPAWLPQMLAHLGVDSIVDRSVVGLAANGGDFIPLQEFFTMQRPALQDFDADSRAGGERSGAPPGGPPSGGVPGGMGGRPGGDRGGIGGMGGGRGMPPMGGGGPPRGRPGDAKAMPLLGPTLFVAQAAALGQYLSRQGPDLIGELADAQLTGKPLDDVLTRRQLRPLSKLDTDFQFWLSERAAALNR